MTHDTNLEPAIPDDTILALAANASANHKAGDDAVLMSRDALLEFGRSLIFAAELTAPVVVSKSYRACSTCARRVRSVAPFIKGYAKAAQCPECGVMYPVEGGAA